MKELFSFSVQCFRLRSVRVNAKPLNEVSFFLCQCFIVHCTNLFYFFAPCRKLTTPESEHVANH